MPSARGHHALTPGIRGLMPGVTGSGSGHTIGVETGHTGVTGMETGHTCAFLMNTYGATVTVVRLNCESEHGAALLAAPM